MSKADRLQNFEITYKELLSCESTAVGTALQTDEDLEQVCLEFQMLYANVALYYAMVEGTEAVTKAWNRCQASHAKLEAAYKAQQQSKPDQGKTAAAVTPSRLSQVGGDGKEASNPLPSFQELLAEGNTTVAAGEATLEKDKVMELSAKDEEIAKLKAQLVSEKAKVTAVEKTALDVKKKQEKSRLHLQQELEKTQEALAKEEKLRERQLKDLKAREERKDQEYTEMASQLEEAKRQALITRERYGPGGWKFAPTGTYDDYPQWKEDPMVRRVMNDLKVLLEPLDDEEYEPNTDLAAQVYEYALIGSILGILIDQCC